MTLKAWRIATNRTVAEVANELGISRQSYSRYEAGTRVPERSILNKIVLITGGAVTANSWLDHDAALIAASASGLDVSLIVQSQVDARLCKIRGLIDQLLDREAANAVLQRLEAA